MPSPINYVRSGSGEPVVLIHGIAHWGRAWEPVPSILSETHDVITLDLPGNGASPPPNAPQNYSMPSIVDQLRDFFDDLGLDKPHVAGSSLGGYLALMLAEQGSVSSCTTFSPAGFYTRPETMWAGGWLMMMKAGSVLPKFALRKLAAHDRSRAHMMSLIYAHPQRMDADRCVGEIINTRTSPSFWHHYFTMASADRLRGNPDVPTTIAWGRQDKLLLPAQAVRARRYMPHARHVWIDDAGHCPMLDQPHQVAALIRETSASSTSR